MSCTRHIQYSCLQLNSCYYSWACRQSFLCLRLHSDEAYGSIQWKMTHKPRLHVKTADNSNNSHSLPLTVVAAVAEAPWEFSGWVFGFLDFAGFFFSGLTGFSLTPSFAPWNNEENIYFKLQGIKCTELKFGAMFKWEWSINDKCWAEVIQTTETDVISSHFGARLRQLKLTSSIRNRLLCFARRSAWWFRLFFRFGFWSCSFSRDSRRFNFVHRKRRGEHDRGHHFHRNGTIGGPLENPGLSSRLDREQSFQNEPERMKRIRQFPDTLCTRRKVSPGHKV